MRTVTPVTAKTVLKPMWGSRLPPSLSSENSLEMLGILKKTMLVWASKFLAPNQSPRLSHPQLLFSSGIFISHDQKLAWLLTYIPRAICSIHINHWLVSLTEKVGRIIGYSPHGAHESTQGTRILGWLTVKIDMSDMSISGSLGFNFDLPDIGNLTRLYWSHHILTLNSIESH